MLKQVSRPAFARGLSVLTLLLMTASAHAASYTFVGDNSAGVDPLGENYTVTANCCGGASFQETVDEQADPTQEVTFHAGYGLADATSFTLTETGAQDPLLTSFDYAFDHYVPGGEGDYWSPTFVSPYEITFTAPVGDKLVTGDQFLTYVGFQNPLPTGFSYSITWSGVAASAVPEPSTWATMAIGFAGLGLAAWRGSRKTALRVA